MSSLYAVRLLNSHRIHFKVVSSSPCGNAAVSVHVVLTSSGLLKSNNVSDSDAHLPIILMGKERASDQTSVIWPLRRTCRPVPPRGSGMLLPGTAAAIIGALIADASR